MAPRRRQAPCERGRSQDDRQHAVAELRERATAQARALVTGDDWAAWLRLAARLPGWSFSNILLIGEQRPTVTLVAGYRTWRGHGRPLRKGKPGDHELATPHTAPRRPRTPSPGAPGYPAGQDRKRRGH